MGESFPLLYYAETERIYKKWFLVDFTRLRFNFWYFWNKQYFRSNFSEHFLTFSNKIISGPKSSIFSKCLLLILSSNSSEFTIYFHKLSIQCSALMMMKHIFRRHQKIAHKLKCPNTESFMCVEAYRILFMLYQI